MSAFNARDDRQAAALFSAFVAQYPRDPRAEDAAYLRVLCLRRLGDPVQMKAAASEYLRHYPRGFRRAEIEALTQ